MDEFYSKHYITIDARSRVTDGWSDGPQSGRDTAGAICINDQGSYQFRLYPDGEENPALRDMDGIPLYKWDGAQVLPRTEEEIEADRAAAVDLSAIKSARVAESKTALADYLAGHPLIWTDGKRYSVTEEKQSLLMGNIAAYQLEAQGNPAAEITWNATGEPCTIWEYADLCALAVAIKAYVKPLVAYQQAKEVEIMACETARAVEAVTLDYGSVADA